MVSPKLVRRARARLLLILLAKTAMRNAAVLLFILIIIRVSGMWIPSAVIFVLATAAETMARAPGRIDAALALDRALATHELFATALEMEFVPGDMPLEIRDRADRAAKDCDLDRALPISLHPILVAAPIILTAVLLVVSERPERPARIVQFQKNTAGLIKNTPGVRIRIETSEAVMRTAYELEDMGILGIEDAIRRGDGEEASSAVSRAERTGLNRTRASDAIDRLMNSVRDPDLRSRIAASGGADNLPGLAEILAEYARGANVGALRDAQDNSNNGYSRTDIMPQGPSPNVDIDSVPPRYRSVVKRYFTE